MTAFLAGYIPQDFYIFYSFVSCVVATDLGMDCKNSLTSRGASPSIKKREAGSMRVLQESVHNYYSDDDRLISLQNQCPSDYPKLWLTYRL